MAHQDITETAARMARSLWNEEHGRDPKASEADDYLALVSRCVKALRALSVGTGSIRMG